VRDSAARLARLGMVQEEDVVDEQIDEQVELAVAVPGVLIQPESSRLKPDLGFDCWTTWQ
jgi:hypothetical protein